MDLEHVNGTMKGLFPGVLGMKITDASADCLIAELDVRDELCTIPGRLHGGALMAMADTMGAFATVLNLPPEAKGTTTIESKTNFFASVAPGQTIRGESTPLHRGKRTQVWQTRIETAEGRLVAMVTQTQMVLS